MEDTENTVPIVAASAKSLLSVTGKQPILPLARKALQEKNNTYENGNLCERGQGSPIEAVTTKSFNEDPVSTPPKPDFAVTEEKSQNSAEEDQSQALTDTNSASFVSLNTLSASEAVFNSATGDHSRPISADTDSLDYESADEAVKTEDQEENGVKLNESLGLDALTNKLSNLYLNSPNVSKKSPAFHSEDTSSVACTTVLSDESISDISFSASLVEVIQHTSQTVKQPEDGHSTVELVVEEISEPEELAEPEKLVEPEKKEEHIVSPVEGKQQVESPIKPEEPAAKQEGQTEFLELDNKVLSAELASEVEPQAELESGAEPQAEEPGKTELETEPELENKAESQAEKQSKVEFPTEESAVTSDELALLVATEDISCAVVPEVIVALSDTDQASENLLEVNELSAIQTETAEIKEEKSQDTKAVEEQLVSETRQETPVAVLEAPQEKVVEEAPATLESLDEPKQQQTGVASAPEKELEEPCTQESGAVEEESAKEETNEELVQLVDPEVAPTAFEHKEPELVEEPQESESLKVPKESDHFEEPDTCKSVEAQKEQEPLLETLNAEKVQAEQLEVVADPEVSNKPEKGVEFSGEVSFEEPNLISLDSTESVPSEALIQDFELAKEQIDCQLDRQDQVVKLELFKQLDQPEKEVSEEKPVVERKIAPATVFIQEKKEVETLKKEPFITSTGSLSELLDLCKQQQRNLEDEVDTQVVEETNELQERIAADADLVCQVLNDSIRNINAEMSDNEAPITPPRRSRSPRKPSPGRNVDFEEDPFKSKARVGISPSRETMNLSAESVLVSSRMSMSKSTDSASMKLMRSMDSGIAGAEMNHSEAGPDIASQDEQFVPATEELFKDPSAFDFLSKFGGNDSSASRLERESLYVKFDPLVGNRDRKVFLSPCIEASPRSEEISDTPTAASKTTAKSDTPLTSRHAVGPLVQIATPVQEPQVVQPTAASKENQQREAEKEALQQMIVLHKKESEELKKLMTSQIEDYEQTIGSLQAKLKQKTEAEEQMSLVMKEYEDTISRILAEKEKAMEKSQEEKQKLTDELAIIQSDLSAAEIAFSDLHRKYERSKSAIEVFKSNENTLKQSNLQFQEQIKQAEKKYMILKTHAEDKLEQAAKENEALVKSSELEISALKAQNAQLKARNNTLVETLGMRERENQELVTICDDLVKKLGPH
ncbi:transforming acidic coiled-coil-containing protein 3 isoform X2 [Cloeon dipterum]|uniref:transforming acidic coiled-coil-containing protein 3 isoform X2 n=1 Tax=Cloeon dipterum TaxID=197152 RepID=UPI0032204073